VGHDVFDKLCALFTSVRNCGFTAAELDDADDSPLFVRVGEGGAPPLPDLEDGIEGGAAAAAE
jgi:hypothetical protein